MAVLSLFSSTDYCESLCFAMNFVKANYTSSLNEEDTSTWIFTTFRCINVVTGHVLS